MIRQSYSIHIAVHDLAKATRNYQAILGIDPIAMTGSIGPGSSNYGVEFPVGGAYCLGLVTSATGASASSADPIARRLAEKGEGVCSFGVLVDDLERHRSELVRAGIQLLSPTPTESAFGRSLFTEPSQTSGVMIQFSQPHDPAGEEQRWSERARAAKDRRAYRAYVLDLAVRDLSGAREIWTKALGLEGIPMPPGADPSDSMDAVHFTVGGPAENGLGGLYALGLMTPRGAPRGPIPQAVNETLAAHGDGGFLVAFLTHDLERQIAHLTSLGIHLCYDEPMRYVHGRLQMTEPVHGVWLDFAEHDADAFERWQSGH